MIQNLLDHRLQKEISALLTGQHSKEHWPLMHVRAYGCDVRELKTNRQSDSVNRCYMSDLKPFGFAKEMISLTVLVPWNTLLDHCWKLSNPDIQSMFMDETMYHLWMACG